MSTTYTPHSFTLRGPEVPVEREAAIRRWMRANPETVSAFMRDAMDMFDRERSRRYVLFGNMRDAHAKDPLASGHGAGEQPGTCLGCEMLNIVQPDEAER